MIRFRDFVPSEEEAAGFLKPAKCETPEAVFAKIDAFVAKHNCDVINIETVLLPNMHQSDERSVDMQIWTRGDRGTTWYQVFRLWYRLPE